ncbi:MAG: phosphotransferase [Burkholderiales bacterium]|jgi:aminoglycoside phosphotransferase (APT) family kinase protein|nr:phosphotransferase [Burkholderiales bacterium]
MHEEFVGTRPVDERHRFDTTALEAWLAGRIDGFRGPIALHQFNGGQSNPTFLLDAGGRQYVLRRKPPGKLLPSAHAVDREFRVISALHGTDVPVARPYALCEDPEIIGSAFYVMAYVPGRVLWDPSLPGLDAVQRAAVFDELNRVIAAMHALDPVAIGLADYGRSGQYIERQLARWTTQYRASETERIEAMEHLIEWLPQHVPAGDETRLVHGDYRLDNVMFDATAPRIVAVLDWELSTLGHPLADFAYHCMTWRLTPEEFRGMAGFDFATLGIPTEAQYVARYCARTGRAGIAHWDWYLAFNMFRLAAILQGIMGRVVAGTASSEHAREQGRRARPMAEAGWRQVEALLRAPTAARVDGAAT